MAAKQISSLMVPANEAFFMQPRFWQCLGDGGCHDGRDIPSFHTPHIYAGADASEHYAPYGQGEDLTMSLGQQLHPHLPFLRRYARALTGSQAHGDAYVRAALEAIVAAPEEFPSDVDPRLGLYRTFHAIWSSSHLEDIPVTSGGSREAIAQARLARLTPLPRQALLLTALEGFTVDDVAYLIDMDSADVEALVEEALSEIEAQTRAKVLIIEDEPIIAMDIETIVRDLGHDVTAILSLIHI